MHVATDISFQIPQLFPDKNTLSQTKQPQNFRQSVGLSLPASSTPPVPNTNRGASTVEFYKSRAVWFGH